MVLWFIILPHFILINWLSQLIQTNLQESKVSVPSHFTTQLSYLIPYKLIQVSWI